MQPDPFGFRAAERAGLVPYRVRHAEAAQVMKAPITASQLQALA